MEEGAELASPLLDVQVIAVWLATRHAHIAATCLNPDLDALEVDKSATTGAWRQQIGVLFAFSTYVADQLIETQPRFILLALHASDLSQMTL